MSLLDDLVSVTVSISDAAVDAESFSYLLIVAAYEDNTYYTGDVTDDDGNTLSVPDGAGEYSSLSEVAAAGWESGTDTYSAAAAAFANGAESVFIIARYSDEDAEDTLARAEETSGWYAICIPSGLDDWSAVCAWAEAEGKLLCIAADVSDGIDAPVEGDWLYTAAIATKTEANLPIIAAAFLAKCLSYEPGSETWAFKTLSSVTADSYTSTELSTLRSCNLNWYCECAGKGITLNGQTLEGEYIDVVRFRDWLVSDMQTRVYGLFIANSKVPYTDAGIALIENQMLASLQEGQTVGGIAADYYDDDGELVPGYTVSVLEAASCSSSDRADRILRNCTFTATLSGAIHAVKITGTLSA